MTPSPPRAVVFDLDGTLVDSLEDLADAANQTLIAFDRPPVAIEVIRRRIGRGARNLVAASIGEEGPIDEALAFFLRVYRATLTSRSRPFPGVLELLEALGRGGVIRAVATNKPSAFTAPLLRGLGLADHLEGWASGDEAERKPDPSSVALALARSGLEAPPPASVVYVGDMPVDVATARAFGCPVITVGWGFDPAGCREAEPDAMVDSAEALASALGVAIGMPAPRLD